MAVTITIQGTPIEIPSVSEDPNWGQGIIEAFQAVEGALSGIVGAADVPSQNLGIDSYNPGTANINALSFSTTNVRSATIDYSVFRQTTTASAHEKGTIQIVYNPNNPVSEKWDIARSYVGDGSISFAISDTGQVSFTTTALGGLNHTGKIAFSAKAFLQS